MRLFISALITLRTCCAFTQDFNYHHFSIPDGLPSSTIYTSCEDSAGFVWFGTDNGLVRFDGYHFKQFTTADGLPDNEVLHLWNDRENRIWISCYNSPISYLKNNIIYTPRNSALLQKVPKTFVYDGFLEAGDGTVCISGLSSSILIRGDSVILLDLPGRNGNPMNNFVEVNQKIYLLSYSAFYRTDINPVQKVAEISHFDSLMSFNKNEIFGNKVYLFNHSREIVENRIDLPGSYTVRRKIPFYAGVSAICKYNDSTFVVATDNGFVFTDTALNITSTVYLKGKNISNLFLSRSGDLWIATTGDGIYFLPFNKCISFDFSYEIESGSITAFAEMNDSTIIAGNEKGQIYILQNQKLKTRLPAITEENNYRKIINIQPVDDWLFVTASSGFYKLQMNNQLQKFGARAIIKTACWYGDTLFSGSSAEGCFLNNRFDHGDTILRKRIIASQFDHNGNVWFATLDSLYAFSNGRLQPQTWYQLEKHSRISALRFLENGAIVLATYNNGILIRNHESIIQLSTKNGLAGNLCRDLFIDAQDHILICTSNGLAEVKFDTTANKIISVRNYSTTDGLLSNSTYTVFVSGQIAYVGTNSGISLIRMHTENLSQPIPVVITEFNGKSYTVADPYHFNHDENDIHLEYTGISFNRNEPLFYTYRLKGTAGDWDTTFQNGINYPNLGPGEYTFEIYAHDGRGNKSLHPAIVSFEIEAAFWQTIYFKIIVLLLLITLIYFIINYRLGLVRKKEQAKHAVEMQITELKLSAIRAQMNPHFIFNALNSIQHFNIVHNFDSAQKYLADFSRLVRKTLDFSTQNFVQLADEIDYLNHYLSLEQLRFEDQFGYSIIKSDEVPSETEIPSQIIQPYVENAINHGIKFLKDEKGILKIHFYIEDNSLFCVIDDNGIGINESVKINANRQHISQGLNLSKSRIQAMNELYHLHITLSIEDKSDDHNGSHGTRVIIRIPLQPKTV